MAADVTAVGALTAATGFFSPAEIDIAIEVVAARLGQGLASGYHFLFADGPGGLDGYACFGPIALTQSAYDLYWIAVRPERQGSGLGRRLLLATEAAAIDMGATAMYVDTAGRPQYSPTRAFYRRLGYRQTAEFPDFYAPGDAKIVFAKRLPP